MTQIFFNTRWDKNLKNVNHMVDAKSIDFAKE